MRLHSASGFALLIASVGTTLPGQGVVPPLQLGQIDPLPGLNAGSVPGTEVGHVHMVHLSGDPPNVFYCTATLKNLPASNGGAGDYDLVCGSYDVLTDTFVPNNDAAALNTAAAEWGLMLHHTGLFAVFDRHNSGFAWLASRPTTAHPWHVVAFVDWLHPDSSYSPALADYRGQPHLIYRFYSQIAMEPIDLATARLTPPRTVIVDGINGFAESPIPVIDPAGELIGVSHSNRPGLFVDGDQYVSLDLDPSTPAVLMNDTSMVTWANGFIGGRHFASEWSLVLPIPPHVFAVDTIWFTGGRAPVGGVMHVRLFSPPTTAPVVFVSVLAVSTAFVPVGLPLPPALGLAGIDAANAWTSPTIQHDNRNGEARIGLAIPNSPGLSGLRLPAQSVTYEAVSGVWHLGNTASLVVE